jgi:cell division protein FtsB
VKPNLRRLLGVVVLVAVAAFAIEGGEYGTTDLFSQRAREKRLVRQIDSLRKQVDSLTRYKRALQTDAALQERIAREEFGMVREKEILYRFAEPARRPPP